ncbi:AbrB/MazE/SpoVT family DNA-binding domain-containing protein [Chitinilyticum litopenaei]|uniref:AbrB/MazE/SpoVT family DNA-binding domain-containing protein n=1 Tax=Chitinilyticum litopenaei TaxID=1121276 RepID=UPI0003FDB780|nr:AbrB/MazE/SpoVT family DNA-binding domain-containing protein [Chitinilyticum litopenaei]
MRLSIQKWGNSASVRLPAALLEQIGATVGSTLDVTVTKDGVLLKPARRPSYKLADLLAQCDASQPLPEDLAAWENMTPIGREEV